LAEQLRALWQRYGRQTLAELPTEVRVTACQCMLDWLGCTLAGSIEPLARIIRDEFEAGPGAATVIGADLRVPARAAALINGATGHALDFDDSNLWGGGHLTGVVTSAALALAEQLDASGADLMGAYVVGREIAGRLLTVVGGEHYRRGWHVTSTIGVFGAAAAAAWLLRLDTDQFGRAIGLAASQVSGVHANFGTMTKPFHAGFAAECGLRSALLARRGFTANPDAFERVFAQLAGDIDWTRIEPLADDYAVLHTLLKRFASGHGTQATILATRSLMARGLVADNIVRAEIRTAESVLSSSYGVRVPRTGLQVKFCLPGVCALTLLGQDMTRPASYRDENVQSAAFTELIRRIELVGDDAFEPGTGEIVVRTCSGAMREPLPHTRDAGTVESRAELTTAKFQALATPIIGTDRVTRLRDLILDLASVRSVAEICVLTRQEADGQGC
jgi:2-methylcitrate dehydratase PrpD